MTEEPCGRWFIVYSYLVLQVTDNLHSRVIITKYYLKYYPSLPGLFFGSF